MVLYSQRKHRSSSSHFSLASLRLLFNPFNKIQFATSTCLFVRGCSTDVKKCLTFKSSNNFFKCLFVNCVPYSLMTYWGTPYLSKILLLKNSSMLVGVIFDKASTSNHFVKYLTAMKMNFNWPGPEENGQIMSIPHYMKVQVMSTCLTQMGDHYRYLYAFDIVHTSSYNRWNLRPLMSMVPRCCPYILSRPSARENAISSPSRHFGKGLIIIFCIRLFLTQNVNRLFSLED